jgi:hypothetical protein
MAKKRPAAAVVKTKKTKARDVHINKKPASVQIYNFGINARSSNLKDRLKDDDKDIPLIKICKNMLKKLDNNKGDALLQNIKKAAVLRTGSACTGSNVGFMAEHALTALLGAGVFKQTFACEKAPLPSLFALGVSRRGYYGIITRVWVVS